MSVDGLGDGIDTGNNIVNSPGSAMDLTQDDDRVNADSNEYGREGDDSDGENVGTIHGSNGAQRAINNLGRCSEVRQVD